MARSSSSREKQRSAVHPETVPKTSRARTDTQYSLPTATLRVIDVAFVAGPVGTEQDALPASPNPRIAAARTALALAERGVRSCIVRVSPTAHDRSRCDMVGQLAGIAREKGVSGYLGDGSNRWHSVHRLDLARLFRLAVEKAPAGSGLHGVGEEGVTSAPSPRSSAAM
jgi:nucleoside-diphosphate-sugar epimerase